MYRFNLYFESKLKEIVFINQSLSFRKNDKKLIKKEYCKGSQKKTIA